MCPSGSLQGGSNNVSVQEYTTKVQQDVNEQRGE